MLDIILVYSLKPTSKYGDPWVDHNFTQEARHLDSIYPE